MTSALVAGFGDVLQEFSEFDRWVACDEQYFLNLKKDADFQIFYGERYLDRCFFIWKASPCNCNRLSQDKYSVFVLVVEYNEERATLLPRILFGWGPNLPRMELCKLRLGPGGFAIPAISMVPRRPMLRSLIGVVISWFIPWRGIWQIRIFREWIEAPFTIQFVVSVSPEPKGLGPPDA